MITICIDEEMVNVNLNFQNKTAEIVYWQINVYEILHTHKSA